MKRQNCKTRVLALFLSAFVLISSFIVCMKKSLIKNSIFTEKVPKEYISVIEGYKKIVFGFFLIRLKSNTIMEILIF